MRIRTGFLLGLAIGGLLVIATIAAFGLSQLRLSAAASQNEVLDAIASEGMQLVQLTNEVLLYGELRAVLQWRDQFKELSALLKHKAVSADVQMREQVGRVALFVADMPPLFDRVAAAGEKARRGESATEAGNILSSQLFQKNVQLQAALRNLKSYSDTEIKEAYARSKERILTIFGVVAALVVAYVSAFSLLFRRHVLVPLQALDHSIQQVNAGDVAHRAEVAAAAEIGIVCAAFNQLLDQQEENRRELQYLAYHDVLTGLPNQLLVKDRMEHAMAYAARSGAKVALLFLDLDNFKTINDTLGHPVGDALLKTVATRLRGSARDTDVISRQGGDEFFITLPEVWHADDVATFADKLLEQLALPFEIEGHELSTSVSIGIALYPDDSTDFDTLLKKADTAMYEAKAAGRNTYRFFADQMNVEASEYLRIRNGLRRALEKGEFVLHYQPQIDLATRKVLGFEALIRWKHPELGMVPPGRFIPIAEDSGLIVPIGDWVLREACWQAAAWRDAGYADLMIAVNLSAIQFKRGNIEKTVLDAIEETGIPPRLLELELTESILIQDTESVLSTVQRLKSEGIKLSIDDFGTGYSSLSYLKRLNVDRLKIDQSFVRDLADDPDDAAIVQAIIQMARSLNLRTIAEGVETVQILDRLREYGCDEAQGYHIARPMPAVEVERFLASQKT